MDLIYGVAELNFIKVPFRKFKEQGSDKTTRQWLEGRNEFSVWYDREFERQLSRNYKNLARQLKYKRVA